MRLRFAPGDHLRGIVAGFTALAVGGPATADDWATGPGGNAGRNGQSFETGPTSLNLLWTAGPGAFVSKEAMIWRDFVITTRPSAADIVNQTQVFAYDLDTGALRWTVTLPKSFANSWYTRVEAVDRGVAYVTRCGNGQPEYLYAIDVMTGALRWQSPMTINSNSTEQAAIAPDGDLLTTLDNTHIVRIDAVTGQPVWTTPRTCPSSEGCALAIHGDRVYGWQNQVGGTSVVAYDLATGAFRYSIPLSATQGVQQTQLMVGPDGTIYAPRSVSTTTHTLFALKDTGIGFSVKWSAPIGGGPFQCQAVGPDGSVYAFSTAFAPIRLDPVSGQVTHSAAPLTLPAGETGHPRIATDRKGRVYVTTGTFTLAEVVAYDADLNPLWSEVIGNSNVGGPAIGENGTLVVCSANNVRAYRDPCPGSASTFGEGCPTSTGTQPRLLLSGCPTSGSELAVRVDRASPGAVGLLLLGLGVGVAPIGGGCLIEVLPLLPLSIPLPLGPDGSVTFATTLPAVAGAVDLYLQAVVPGGTFPPAITAPVHLHVQ